jgi:hypothetical protein
MDVDYVRMVGNMDQLIQAKYIEISNIFRAYEQIVHATTTRQMTYSNYNAPGYKR